MSHIIVTDAETLQRFVEAAARKAYDKGAADALATLPLPAPPEPAYLSAEAVAAMLHCAVASLPKQRRLGLPYEHIPGVKGYRYVRADVEAWMESRVAVPQRRRAGLGATIPQVRPPSPPARSGAGDESARTARASRAA